MKTLITKLKHRRKLVDLMETIRLNKGEVQYQLLEMYIQEKERYKQTWGEAFTYDIRREQ